VKFSTPVLLVSLAANIALVAVIYRRPATPAAPPAPATVAKAATKAPAPAASATTASGEIAALEAAGFTPEIAREIVLGRAFSRFAEKLRAARSAAADPRWWRNRTAANVREQEALVRRELADTLLAAFGDDFGYGTSDGSNLSFLSPEKRSALRRITQDYDDMIAKFSAGGLQLASDRERLQLLRAERERDIAALLTPAEFAEYEMRTSTTAAQLRARYGDAIASEDDFQKLYLLQKAFDERYPMPNGRVTPESMRERSLAQRRLQADMRAALGESAFAALTRAADSDLRNIDSLATRLNLPANTTDQIASVRESIASESQRISADTSLTPPQRRAQMQELGNRAKSAVAAALGSEAAEAYTQRSPWLNMLQSGMAFSTTPPSDSMMGMMPGGPGVYPVMPPGGPGMQAGAAVRQVVNLGVADPAAGAPAPPADMFFYSAGTVVAEPAKAIGFDAAGVAPEIKLNTATGPAAGGGIMIIAPAPGSNATPPPASTPQVISPKN
jgi:hypothetical protein